MATNETLLRVVGRAVLEPEFRGDLLNNPARAAASIGVEDLTDEEIERILTLDETKLESARMTLIRLVDDVYKMDVWYPSPEEMMK